MKTAVLLMLIPCLAAAVYVAWERNRTVGELTLALQIWQHCPMPPKGFAMVIEADWPGQQPDDAFRCGYAKKRSGNVPPVSALPGRPS